MTACVAAADQVKSGSARIAAGQTSLRLIVPL